jgi:ankyrin repeat protein
VVQQQLPKAADTDAKMTTRATGLLSAAYKGHKAMVRLLLEKGANVDAKMYNGQTVL